MATGRLSDFLEHLRAKPTHHRRRIALGTSVGVTALIAVAWFAAVGTSGAFSLKTGASGTVAANNYHPSAVSDAKAAVTATKSNFSQLLGAANQAMGAASTSSTLTIVDDTTAAPTPAPADTNATDQTSLSF